jgi:serine/threonine protein kinase
MPADLERIIDKSLEKDRNLRYQSAADLRTDLTRLKRAVDAGRSSSASSSGPSLPSGAGVAASVSSSSSVSSVPAAAASGRSRKLVAAGFVAVLLVASCCRRGVFCARKIHNSKGQLHRRAAFRQRHGGPK